MILLAWAYIVWIVPSHPGIIAYKYRVDCEQSRLIDKRQEPVSKCFWKKHS